MNVSRDYCSDAAKSCTTMRSRGVINKPVATWAYICCNAVAGYYVCCEMTLPQLSLMIAVVMARRTKMVGFTRSVVIRLRPKPPGRNTGYANSIFANWRTELALGEISDDDRVT